MDNIKLCPGRDLAFSSTDSHVVTRIVFLCIINDHNPFPDINNLDN